ncbi:cysteine--tRNA ligase [candidate division WOR-3 bacterium]|uniref:Cysteine--tRNA ligase n=1 Tax=candidate division WOR-3 bacterium TaxID=2052148 RepID=A0A660SEM2_UNCW3|nr:MAG: cysteine--tRNA ligase [candidate division WOR-3 bacterium]
MRLKNTLTNIKEEFQPLGDRVGIYTCGMTVQTIPHIGHMKTFITADVLKRYLIFKGYQVTHVTNFTDIDDKIIIKAKESGEDWRALAQRNIDIFFKVSDHLNIMRADYYPRATQFIEEIISLIDRLIQRGFGYIVDGDVYFPVERFPKYGQLAKKELKELMPGARVAVDEKKRHPLDFALWKAAKEGEPWWYSPWGKGRPGWHIECSAMSMYLLGETFDIHTGAEDLIFPHHENEIAQSVSATGKNFVRFWIHNTWLSLSGEKMSKSTGHYLTAEEILQKYSPQAIRLFFLKSHYRMPQEYDEDRLKEAELAFDRVRAFLNRVEPIGEEVLRLTDFEAAMDDDLNTPKALGIIFELVREGYEKIDSSEAKKIAHSVRVLLEVLGFDLAPSISGREKALIEELIRLRSNLRREKRYDLADQIRSRLKELGVIVEDKREGSIWRVVR